MICFIFIRKFVALIISFGQILTFATVSFIVDDSLHQVRTSRYGVKMLILLFRHSFPWQFKVFSP